MATKKTAVENDAIKAIEEKIAKIDVEYKTLSDQREKLNYDSEQDKKPLNKIWAKQDKLYRQKEVLQKELRKLSLTPKEKELEDKFMAVFNETHAAIQAHLATAEKELEKATKLADKTGIPFSSPLAETYNNYVPYSFTKKWGKLDDDFLEELCGFRVPG